MFCFSGQGFSCAQGYFYTGGGTSFSSPIMAAIQSLVNQKTGQQWGNPDQYYYALANTEYGSAGQLVL